MRIHKTGVKCGTAYKIAPEFLTDDDGKVTCKRCKRLIRTGEFLKLYSVKVDGAAKEEEYFISALTSSKAAYKCFKTYFYREDAWGNIGEQFLSFKKRLKTVRREGKSEG